MLRHIHSRRLLLSGALSTVLFVTSAECQQVGGVPPDAPRFLTLDQAQDQASRAINPMHRLGQLNVEAAKQHRLAAQADYFPKVGASFANLHFNKFMGKEIFFQGPRLGTLTAGLPLVGKDLTYTSVNVFQPITPLFKVRQGVNVARADERIARAKAGMAVAANSGTVEKAYFELLIAQQEEMLVRSKVRKVEGGRTVASVTPVALDVEKIQIEAMEARKELADASSKVNELTAALDELLGWAPGTKVVLEAPAPLVETISFQQIADKSVATSADVVEAEQTVVKARAATKLSKLDYVPDVVAIWGYTYNGDAIPLLPRDFSYVGAMATFNVFDFGKREHTVKERKAQLGMAEAALDLAKLKASAAIKQSYTDLVRSRQLVEIARQAQSTIQAIAVKYNPDDPDLKASGAKLEIELLQADLEHRQAYAKLLSMMGDR
jgi:outer membrane protein TolC